MWNWEGRKQKVKIYCRNFLENLTNVNECIKVNVCSGWLETNEKQLLSAFIIICSHFKIYCGVWRHHMLYQSHWILHATCATHQWTDPVYQHNFIDSMERNKYPFVHCMINRKSFQWMCMYVYECSMDVCIYYTHYDCLSFTVHCDRLMTNRVLHNEGEMISYRSYQCTLYTVRVPSMYCMCVVLWCTSKDIVLCMFWVRACVYMHTFAH